MSANLYDVLGINRNASPEDIRRAYRRKALETHPDRLPQGASAAEKAAHGDLFRRVNNAYEVLSDPQNRSTYDQYGVWPPPTSAPQGPYPNGPDPFSDPFFRDSYSNPSFRPRVDPFGGFPFGPRPHAAGGFTDPFVLFNSIFGDLRRAFESDPFINDPFFGRHGFRQNPSPFVNGGIFSGGLPSIMPSPFDLSNGGMGTSRFQAFNSGGNGGQWVSQSWSSSTVNGVTHTKSVRKDSQGNEHVLYRYPDGTERRTINGIDQSASQPQRALPAPYPNQGDSMPPTYSEAVGQQPHRSHSSRRVHYDDYSNDRHRDGDRHRHDYGSRDKDREHGYRDDGRGQGGSGWGFWKS